MSPPLALPPDLSPYGVWDAGDKAWTWQREEAQEWLDAHVGPPEWRLWVRRLEFYVFDGPCVVVFRYKTDVKGEAVAEKSPDGRWHRPVMEDPYVMPLDSLPPDHLFRPAR